MERSITAQRASARRSALFYGLLRPLIRLYARLKFNFSTPLLPKVDGSFLLLSNHNTDYDMLFTCAASPRHMYFVGSEHILQSGFASKLLVWAVSPIIRQKASVAATTVMTVVRTLRRGDNVCLFAEGNRSFDGRTCRILPSTGKLVKAGGATLVTYRLENGYFTSPRWAYTLRRGVMRGRFVNVYPPEMLSCMSADEINAAIEADLCEDAYARQAVEHVPFRGKRLAEGLEHALYICPECGQIGTLHSENNALGCPCGLSVTYDEYGALHGCRFASVTEWSDWQKQKLGEYLDSADSCEIEDEGASLYEVDANHRPSLLYSGAMALHNGALCFGERRFALNKIEGLGICGHDRAVLMHEGRHYEFRGAGRLCALKYLHAYEHIMGVTVM